MPAVPVLHPKGKDPSLGAPAIRASRSEAHRITREMSFSTLQEACGIWWCDWVCAVPGHRNTRLTTCGGANHLRWGQLRFAPLAYSYRPYGTEEFVWTPSPGLRCAAPWAILLLSLRERACALGSHSEIATGGGGCCFLLQPSEPSQVVREFMAFKRRFDDI